MTKADKELDKSKAAEGAAVEGGKEKGVESPEQQAEREKQEKALEQAEEARHAEEEARHADELEDAEIWMSIIRDLEDGQDFEDIYVEFDSRQERAEAEDRSESAELKTLKERSEELNSELARPGKHEIAINNELKELEEKKVQSQEQIEAGKEKWDKEKWDRDWFNAEFQRLGEQMANATDEDEKVRIGQQVQDTQKAMAELGLVAGVVAASELGFGRDETKREQREARVETEKQEQQTADQLAEQARQEEEQAEFDAAKAKADQEKAHKNKVDKVKWTAAAAAIGPVGLAGKFAFGLKPIQGSLPTLPRMAVGAWGFAKQMIGQEDLKFGEASESTKNLDKWLDERDKKKSEVVKKIGRNKRDKEKAKESASEQEKFDKRIEGIKDADKQKELSDTAEQIYVDEGSFVDQRKDLETQLDAEGLSDVDKEALQKKLEKVEKKIEELKKRKEKLEKDLAAAEKAQAEAE
ncbi:hypothetical protein HN358_04985 [Candidatus Uhrbacteria bacterium]|jgi:hypothetical protein|nr:hypothetical protein [Candidatus Uhrbacteria bacterium]MBT7716781.1 hypothetical protein [Candidatus Uhrbacteria bacterium]